MVSLTERVSVDILVARSDINGFSLELLVKDATLLTASVKICWSVNALDKAANLLMECVRSGVSERLLVNSIDLEIRSEIEVVSDTALRDVISLDAASINV